MTTPATWTKPNEQTPFDVLLREQREIRQDIEEQQRLDTHASEFARVGWEERN